LVERDCQRGIAREVLPERYCQRGIAREGLPERDCQRGIVREVLPERDFQRGIAREGLPERYCQRGIAREGLPEKKLKAKQKAQTLRRTLEFEKKSENSKLLPSTHLQLPSASLLPPLCLI
jgi:hypothetical protein